MNKLLTITLLCVLLCGCGTTPNYVQTGNDISEKRGDYKIKVIDSCEYIEYDYGIFDQRVYSLTHKGNCKYCLQRNKK